jgi:hypothetical protein
MNEIEVCVRHDRDFWEDFCSSVTYVTLLQTSFGLTPRSSLCDMRDWVLSELRAEAEKEADEWTLARCPTCNAEDMHTVSLCRSCGATKEPESPGIDKTKGPR